MAINLLSVPVLQKALQTVWQKNLGTSEDPANGRWFTDGANNDAIGLYGGLTDTAPTQLTFNQAAQQYLPTQITCTSSIMDNRNGLNPKGSTTLTYAYANSSSYSQTSTTSVSNTTKIAFEVSASFEGVGAKASTDFSVTMAYSMAQTSGTSTSATNTFSQTVNVDVPKGKVYQAVLTATIQKLQVPYTCAIQVTGTTETWFEDRVNGHYNWSMGAAEAFDLINQYGAAGADSASYGSSGGAGTVAVSGTLTAQQTANFVAQIYDITANYNPEAQPQPAGLMLEAVGNQRLTRLAAPGTQPMPKGTLVKTIPF